MNKRTDVDFSKHELIITTNDAVIIHDLKQPGWEYKHRVKFINTCGIMAVTGDFGNWIFCREFHPSPENGVSGSYWVEKLQISSEQNPYNFDNEGTKKEIEEGLQGGLLEEYGYQDAHLKEMKEYYQDLLNYVDLSEFQYTAFAYENYPSFCSGEDVPFVKEIKPWLLIIFDAFDEICNRLKEEKKTNDNPVVIGEGYLTKNSLEIIKDCN
jgi:hypothetical protein